MTWPLIGVCDFKSDSYLDFSELAHFIWSGYIYLHMVGNSFHILTVKGSREGGSWVVKVLALESIFFFFGNTAQKVAKLTVHWRQTL